MEPAKLIGAMSLYAAVTPKRDHKTCGPKDGPFPELKKADLKIILPQTVKEALSLLARLILIAPGDNKNQVIDTNMKKIKKRARMMDTPAVKKKMARVVLKPSVEMILGILI